MRLTILELPARWNAVGLALADVDSALTARTDTDLVLLPEASLTGYLSPEDDADLTPFAEPLDGPTSRACAALASKHRVHLVAPLVLREGAGLYNAMVCHAPDGTQPFVYRKRHPWIPETWATPGAEPLPVVTIDDRTVTIAICYDLHFLPRESADQLEAADVLLFPSAWVEQPDFRIPRLQRLAHNFSITIANANWGAGDVVVPGQGGSCVVGVDGRVVERVAANRIDLSV
ncbi:MAG: carbon-nitrogen hydrolase family protein [Deltaproteobacteria bacterium]|nr:carbon-nitrogen hydrolase family protein [Deltaproteobacteria bacterium]